MQILNLIAGIALFICFIFAAWDHNTSAIAGWFCAIVWYVSAMIKEYRD